MNNRELARTTCFDNMAAFGKAKATALADALGEFITTGMGLRKSLDALVNNLFKGNATVIGEWATASHGERQGTRKAKPAAGGSTPAPAPKP